MFISVRIDRSVIRVKAMLIAPNLEHTAHAVTLNAPTVENPRGFHRLIGGSVELGERHVDTIRREVDEELGATIRDLAFLTAAENIFHHRRCPRSRDRLPLLRTPGARAACNRGHPH